LITTEQGWRSARRGRAAPDADDADAATPPSPRAPSLTSSSSPRPFSTSKTNRSASPYDNDPDRHLDVDLALLTAADPAPLDPAGEGGDPEARARLLAQGMAQALVARLFSLPAERTVPGGRVVSLPPSTTPLPREKPLPRPKPPTKWQKFAADKGIRKRKRGKLVYDEEQKEWRRRHGKGRAGDDGDQFAVEARSGVDDAPGAEDPFTRQARERRERVRDNGRRQAGNLVRASGGKVTRSGAGEATAGLPATVRLAAAAGVERHRGAGRGKPVLRKDLKDDLRAADRLAGVSTASMGKFDRRLKGERAGERELLSQGRKKAIGVTETGKERRAMAGAADKFLRDRATDVVDVQRAIDRLETASGGRAGGGGGGGAAGGGRSEGRGGRGGGGGGKRGGRGGGGRGGDRDRKRGGGGGDRKGGDRKGGDRRGGVKAGGVRKGGGKR